MSGNKSLRLCGEESHKCNCFQEEIEAHGVTAEPEDVSTQENGMKMRRLLFESDHSGLIEPKGNIS